MDPNRQETINAILDLVQYLEPRFKGMHPSELMEEVKTLHRIDLVEDEEDKLDDLMLKLARLKKTKPTPSSRTMGPLSPIHGTPPPVSGINPPLTNWLVGDRIKHNNCPDWGEGDIVGAELFSIAPDVCQKLQIIFNRAGRKTLVVRPGMLAKIESKISVPAEVAPAK